MLSSCCQSDTDFVFILLQSKYFGLELGIELSFLLLLCAPLLLPLLCSCCFFSALGVMGAVMMMCSLR